MILKNIILRTETFDYFKEQNYREKDIKWMNHDAFIEVQNDKKEKQIKEDKGIRIDNTIKQQTLIKHQHDDNQIKIMKDESTRSLFSVNGAALWKNNCQQKNYIYQEEFECFSYPDHQEQYIRKEHEQKMIKTRPIY